MTIQLKSSIFISGINQPVGTSLTLSAEAEADLVNRGAAVYTARTPAPGENLVPAMLSTDANNPVLVGANGTTYPLSGSSAPSAKSTVMYSTGAQAIPNGTTPVAIALPSLLLEENIAGTGDIATGEFIKPAGASYARFQASVRWNHAANSTATQTKLMIEGWDGAVWTQLPGVGDIQDHAAATAISTTQELSSHKLNLSNANYSTYTRFRLSCTVTCTGSLSTQTNATPFFVVCEAVFQ